MDEDEEDAMLPELSDDASSVVSSDDSGGGDEEDGCADSGAGDDEYQHSSESDGEDGEQTERDRPGSHVVDKNWYFSVTRNPKFRDVKARVLPRWATKEGMGTKGKSKTLTIRYFDPDGEPLVAYLVLRSWMVHRVRRHGFAARKACREKWVAAAVGDLTRDIASCGRSLEGQASVLIEQWCPEAMPRAVP